METKFYRKQYTYLYLTFVYKVITLLKHIIRYYSRKLFRSICKPLFRLVITNCVKNCHSRYIFNPLSLSKNINMGNQTHSKNLYSYFHQSRSCGVNRWNPLGMVLHITLLFSSNNYLYIIALRLKYAFPTQIKKIVMFWT